MAKSNKSESTSTETPKGLLVIEYGTFKVPFETLPAHAIEYLTQYGFGKSLQDSVAGVKKALTAEGKTEAEIAKALADTMQKRFDAIMAGTIGARVGGQRVSGIDKVMRDVAREALKAAAVAKKITLPTGEKLTALLVAYIAKNEAAVRAEAERRMATVATEGDEIDLDALLAETASPDAQPSE